MLFQNECDLRRQYHIIVGVDEAGRGPLAGPVVAAAVILPSNLIIPGLDDSKKLSEKKREILYDQILRNALNWTVAAVSAKLIDELNILQATMLAMKKAINRLQIKPGICLVDGNRVPDKLSIPAIPCIKGDSKFASIAAASIVAKVTRDTIMMNLDQKYPVYQWKKNKGYPTREHKIIIKKTGLSKYHRKSFHCSP